MSQRTLLVTGAAGQLGRRVLELLLEQQVGPLIATTRSPDKLAALRARGVEVRSATFDDPGSLRSAFTGAERALLISTDDFATPGRRIEQHQNAVRALDAAGVRHVVYTSLPNPEGSLVTLAKDHAATEVALRESRLGYTVLRNNLYADLLAFTLPRAIASGELIDARGSGAVAYVTREDCARVAAAALCARDAPERSTHDVTGPEPITSARLASLLGTLLGRTIEHVAVSNDELLRSMRESGLPARTAELYASFDAEIVRGRLGTVSKTVESLTKHSPRRLEDYLAGIRKTLLAPPT